MSQITEEQRYTISKMQKGGYKQSEISKTIGKDKSVVSREIKRNKDQRSGVYGHELAERKCRERHRKKPKNIDFTQEIQERAEELLKKKYSPKQIKGYCDDNALEMVSHETLYKHLWKDKKQGGELYKDLRNQGRKYRKRGADKDKRGIIKNRVSIDLRPGIVDKRSRFGDLEVDLILGKDNKGAILTINDRASGYLKMIKVSSKDSRIVAKAINGLLEDWIPYLHTITADNGKEFAGHQDVAEFLSIDYYFAHPYHSWERGSNENLNGLIRQYIPKKTDFNTITDQYIETVQQELNNRPRERFNFKNPNFVMNQLLFN